MLISLLQIGNSIFNSTLKNLVKSMLDINKKQECKETLTYFHNNFLFYFQESKVREILEAGENLDLLSQLGLLLDAEADNSANNESKFLMQIFTKPVFGKDTFFLEVLERRGAKGFGAGNITALAQSIILYQKQLEQN